MHLIISVSLRCESGTTVRGTPVNEMDPVKKNNQRLEYLRNRSGV